MKWLFWLACAQGVSAQQSTLRGTVLSAETREPLGLSIVTLVPSGGKQFTDPSGVFAFPDIPAGTYLLSVRQIGYAPLDTQIIVRDDRPTTFVLALRHLAIELPPVTITGRARCTTPGPPDPKTSPALAVVFEQLQENARRYALLADSYPFEYQLEQTLRNVNARGDTLRPRIDTLRLTSRDERPYQPGRVVTPSYGPWRGDLLVRTMALEEFSNPTFVKNHCFYLMGRDTIEGEKLVRVDFEPAAHLGADMAGAAYLDSVTYQLRFTESSLTRPEQSELDNVKTMIARTRFRDIGQGIPVRITCAR
jgi:hypothetical protein